MFDPQIAAQIFTTIIEAEAAIFGIVCAFYIFIIQILPVFKELPLPEDKNIAWAITAVINIIGSLAHYSTVSKYRDPFWVFFILSIVTMGHSLGSMYFIGTGTVSGSSLEGYVIMGIVLFIISILALFYIIHNMGKAKKDLMQEPS
jgi:hypothetical protein